MILDATLKAESPRLRPTDLTRDYRRPPGDRVTAGCRDGRPRSRPFPKSHGHISRSISPYIGRLWISACIRVSVQAVAEAGSACPVWADSFVEPRVLECRLDQSAHTTDSSRPLNHYLLSTNPFPEFFNLFAFRPFFTRPSLPTARKFLFSTMAPFPIAVPNGPSPNHQELFVPTKGEQSSRLHTEVVIIGSGPAGHTA